jgi:hypothetical protein
MTAPKNPSPDPDIADRLLASISTRHTELTPRRFVA